MRLVQLVRGLFNRVQPADTLAWLDTVVSTNEIRLNELNAEISAVEGLLAAEENKIRGQLVEGRHKKFTLQTIKRLRTQLTTLERRMDILDRNIGVGMSLISKFKDMEAMALQGVKTQQIDDVILEFETRMNQYLTVASTEIEPTDDICDGKELEDLEKEILGVKPFPIHTAFKDYAERELPKLGDEAEEFLAKVAEEEETKVLEE